MKKTIYLGFLFFIIFTSKAQLGQLRITYYDYSLDNNFDIYQLPSLKIILRNNTDSIIAEHNAYEGEEQYQITIDSLIPGKYKLTVFNNYCHFEYSVLIRENKKTTIEVQLSKATYEVINRNDSTTSNKYESQFLFSLGPKNLKNNSEDILKNSYSLGFFGQPIIIKNKNFSLFPKFGSSLTYVDFRNDKSLDPSFNKKRERIIAWNLNFGIGNRISFFNNQKIFTKGLFIDYGILYNFPILFNHAIINNGKRIENKWIHQYTDFSAFLCFGYYPISFLGEYRLTNYVISGFPELPRIKLGVIFHLSAENFDYKNK